MKTSVKFHIENNLKKLYIHRIKTKAQIITTTGYTLYSSIKQNQNHEKESFTFIRGNILSKNWHATQTLMLRQFYNYQG